MARYDYNGLWWSDRNKIGILPSFDDSWKPVTEFPNLHNVKVLGLDTETYDPNLDDNGPGWAYGDGNIVGVSLATEDKAWYFPISHTVQPELNLNADSVFRYLNDVLSSNCPKVGANLQYDVGWLRQHNVTVNGPLYDVQFAEALLDDVAVSYSLDTLAKTYLGKTKVTSELYTWADKAYGKEKDQRKNIYRCPPSLVGPYAEADASLPLIILKQQWGLLSADGLLDLFKLECRLIRVLIGMRYRGMQIDEQRAIQAQQYVTNKIEQLRVQLKDHAGFHVAVNSNADLAKMFTKHKQAFPRTEAGNPSFVKDWLQSNPYVGAQLVYNIRRYEKALSSFIEGAILDKIHSTHDTCIRPSLHPLRGEFGGAVSGRFSCSKPNGQQIPSRDDELASIIRGIFVPEPDLQWGKFDYSQIEYRLFAHHSGDETLIEAYEDPDADFHETVNKMLGGMLARTPVKNFNFGMLYGLGKDKLFRMLRSHDLPIDPEDFYNLYHEKFPAARQIIRQCSHEANTRGEIRTILRRRNTFNLWEPKDMSGPPLQYNAARAKYGREIQRAGTYKALNRKLQGGAADIMKKAMVDLYESGVLDVIGYPYITVHDELDFGYSEDYRKEFLLVKEILETTVPLKVPLKADFEVGPDWGHLEEYKL